ncbi:hypothetical protein AC480_04015, partial [miscellaneous Crenarchaeota group archaeon SMTZ1-55]
MKIVDIKPYVIGVPQRRNWVFCKLVTDEGIAGWGECPAPWLRENTLAQAIHELGQRFVVGQDPFNIESIWEALYKSAGSYRAAEQSQHSHHLQHPGVFHGQVVGSIEMACWDIVGKALNQPIYKLLGGVKNEKLRAYTYLHNVADWRAGDAPETAGPAALRVV